MNKIKLAVIFGSRSCEHDVSIISALQLMDAVNQNDYEIIPVYISREGLWYTGEALRHIETFRNFNPMGKNIMRVIPDLTANAGDLWEWPPKKAGLFSALPAPIAHIDCVIPVLHGMNGEDGTVSGLLELANIPYTCSGVLGSSVGMDKIALKYLFRGAGLPIVDFIWFTRESLEADADAIYSRVEEELRYPVFVKPATLGSSIGISRVKNREELSSACELAATYDRRILVEMAVEHPTEVNCAALGFGETVRVSACEMPVPSDPEHFLDFYEKYLQNASAKDGESRGMKSLSRVLPAPLGDALTARIEEMTKRVFRLLDCKGTVRVDFILDENGILYINEPNTIPGSMAFYLWKASGLPFSDLIDKMVEDAMRAHAEKNRNVYAYDANILDRVVTGVKGTKR